MGLLADFDLPKSRQRGARATRNFFHPFLGAYCSVSALCFRAHKSCDDPSFCLFRYLTQ